MDLDFFGLLQGEQRTARSQRAYHKGTFNMSFVTNTDWNTLFCDYDSLNNDDKDHYMIGAQAEPYIKQFKKFFEKAIEEIESMDSEAKVEDVQAVMNTLRADESRERDAVKRLSLIHI